MAATEDVDGPDLAPVNRDDLQLQLKNTTIGREIYAFNQLSSTNSLAKRLASDGATEGTVVVSDYQSSGRGRLDRSWHMTPGKALSFSIILRPVNVRLDELSLLSLMTCISVAQTCEAATKKRVEVKWPNDALMDTRKFCGILVESEISNDKLAFAVVGVGINVNQDKTDFPLAIRRKATSMRISSGRTYDRTSLLASLLTDFDRAYARFKKGGRDFVRKEWTNRCLHLDSTVGLLVGEEIVSGIFEGIDQCGRMRLRTESGIQVFGWGEISSNYERNHASSR